jgi:hypothetical protein
LNVFLKEEKDAHATQSITASMYFVVINTLLFTHCNIPHYGQNITKQPIHTEIISISKERAHSGEFIYKY